MEIRKILVPVIGTEADKEAIRLACTLAKKGALPLDAEIEPDIIQAESVLDRMESIAEENDYEIDTDLLQAREVGPAIVDEAAERGTDLILMGVTYKTRFGQFTMGDVVPYVMRNAPCRVILLHQPIT